ncbi:MAG TPA: hypothetical protein DEB40_10060, partial [Elusimicrobia bacterium]|nr:hypothetical protein [Elusimicrobiota bacterium]
LTAQASLTRQTCAVEKKVCKSGCAYSSIQAALDSITPKTLSGYTCVIIKDAQTYSEQVTVQGFTNAGSSLTIMTDSFVLPNHAVINPPQKSTAAFHIMQTSVNIFNVDVISTNTVQYGVLVSSMLVRISSVNVDAGGMIWTAGMLLRSWNTVSYSSVSVSDAQGYLIEAATMTAISHSSAAVLGSGVSDHGLYVNNSGSNTVSNSFFSNPDAGAGVYLQKADYNTISFSTAVTNNPENTNVATLFFFSSSDSNTITRCSITNSSGPAVYFNSSAYNTVNLSTIAATKASGAVAVQFKSEYDLVTQSFIIIDGLAQGVQFYGAASQFNTLSLSTVVAKVVSAPVNSNLSAYNMVTQCYISHDTTYRPSAPGVYYINADFNTLSLSTVTSDSTYAAIQVNDGASSNLFDRDFAINTGTGRSMVIEGTSPSFNTISRSTIISTNEVGLMTFNSTSTLVLDSYIQGATYGMDLQNAYATTIGNSFIAAKNSGADGIYWESTCTDLRITSSVIQAGPGAGSYGIRLAANSKGVVVLSTNTVRAGPQYGVYVDDMLGGAQVWITSNTIIPTLSSAMDTYGIYLNGLTTGATIYDNSIVYRTNDSHTGRTTYGLYATGSTGLNIRHNRISYPGADNNGSVVSAYFNAAAGTDFQFNDVNSTGTNLATAYLLQLNASTIAVKNNIFLSSWTVTAASASLYMSANSGIDSNYNDWFSSNALTFIWGKAFQGVSAWQGANKDANSFSAHPFWHNPGAGIEDFHLKT